MTKNNNIITKGEGTNGKTSEVDFSDSFMLIGGNEAGERRYKNDNADASIGEALEKSRAFRFKHGLGKAANLSALFSVGES